MRAERCTEQRATQRSAAQRSAQACCTILLFTSYKPKDPLGPYRVQKGPTDPLRALRSFIGPIGPYRLAGRSAVRRRRSVGGPSALRAVGERRAVGGQAAAAESTLARGGITRREMMMARRDLQRSLAQGPRSPLQPLVLQMRRVASGNGTLLTW